MTNKTQYFTMFVNRPPKQCLLKVDKSCLNMGILGFNKSRKKFKFLPSVKPFLTTITLYHKLSVIVRLSAKTKQSIRHFSLFSFATLPDL